MGQKGEIGPSDRSSREYGFASISKKAKKISEALDRCGDVAAETFEVTALG